MLKCDGYQSAEWLRLLLIEGDSNDRALFGHAVEASGLGVWLSTAPSADEAIAYLEGRERYADRELHPWPDLIVLALKLPGMSGLEFLEWKRKSAAREVPVVVFTGFAYPREIEQARSLGAERYVPKPLDFREFQRAVFQVLEFGLGLRSPKGRQS